MTLRLSAKKDGKGSAIVHPGGGKDNLGKGGTAVRLPGDAERKDDQKLNRGVNGLQAALSKGAATRCRCGMD